MLSMLKRENELQAEKNRTLWNVISNVGGEQRDESDYDAGRAQYASMRELVVEYLESDGSQVCAAKTRAKMDACLGWLAAIRNLERNSVLRCSPLRTGGRLLLTGRGAKPQAGHK